MLEIEAGGPGCDARSSAVLCPAKRKHQEGRILDGGRTTSDGSKTLRWADSPDPTMMEEIARLEQAVIRGWEGDGLSHSLEGNVQGNLRSAGIRASVQQENTMNPRNLRFECEAPDAALPHNQSCGKTVDADQISCMHLQNEKYSDPVPGFEGVVKRELKFRSSTSDKQDSTSNTFAGVKRERSGDADKFLPQPLRGDDASVREDYLNSRAHYIHNSCRTALNGRENSIVNSDVNFDKDPIDGTLKEQQDLHCAGAFQDNAARGSSPATNEKQQLCFPSSLKEYLPEEICSAMNEYGSTNSLYPWQAACLNTPGVLQGRSIVYSAPTSGGKTLVAEILMLRRIIMTGKPVLLVLPFVSLCAEKSARLRTLLSPLGRQVVEFYGGVASVASPLSEPSVGAVVATIEKANMLINTLLEQEYESENTPQSAQGGHGMSQLSAVCVDELHLVGDEDRGYQLELMLTKLMYAKESSENVHVSSHQTVGQAAVEQQVCDGWQVSCPIITNDVLQASRTTAFKDFSGNMGSNRFCSNTKGIINNVQIIGMSATLPNMDRIAQWLDAALYVSEYRPVPLQQYIMIENKVLDAKGNFVRLLESSHNLDDTESILPDDYEPSGSDPSERDKRRPDGIALLAQETVESGHSVIIFCASRASCEQTSQALSGFMKVPERRIPWHPSPDGVGAGALLPQPPTRESIRTALRQDADTNENLISLVQKGISYHHAGMTTEERELVEIGFRCGAIRVLCATSTVATGVNLPARRVIFKHTYVGLPSKVLDASKYRQMAGRAGRAGVDSIGEVYVVARSSSAVQALQTLMHDEPKAIESCLCESRRGMKRAILEVVASGAVQTAEDVDKFVRCTLLSVQLPFGKVAEDTRTALVWLGHKDRGFIVWNHQESRYQPTQFGKAVLGAGLSPDVCVSIKEDLERARDALVLSTDLHLTYLCVPVSDDIAPNWKHLEDIVSNRLRKSEILVIERIGVDRSFLSKRAASLPTSSRFSESIMEQERICRRLWVAIILSDILQERPLSEVQDKYSVPRGFVQGLQDRSSRYAGMLSAFCERMGWYDVEALISKFQARVLHGVRQEIVALMEIPFVKGSTARVLYRHGMRSAESIAASGIDRIARVLETMRGWKHGTKDASQARRVARMQAGRILKATQETLRRKAMHLRAEAALAAQAADVFNSHLVAPKPMRGQYV